MKIIRGLAIFSVIAVSFGSCFDPPIYPVTPQIELNRNPEFVDAAKDSLFLYIDFKDGDGDLGLDGDDPKYRSFPFNDAFYYQENNGELLQLYSEIEPSSQRDFIHIPDPTVGKLVFPRTRKKPEYADNVPEFAFPARCTNYVRRSILIKLDDAAVLDEVAMEQSVQNEVELGGVKYLEIVDTLYFTPNQDHYNIEVNFYTKVGNDYVEYDWRKDGCDRVSYTGQTFDARFPMFTDKEGTTLEGTLKYGMYSLFKETFGNKTLRLEIQIKDRARNKSNVIVTDDFTLLEILKK